MIYTLLAAAWGILLGIFSGKYLADKWWSDKKQEAEKLKQEATAEIEATKKECRRLYDLAERKGQELIEKAEKEIAHRHKKVDQLEEKIAQKEERMDEKMEKLEEKKEEYITKKQELEKVVEQQKTILSDLSGLTPDQAKEELFKQIEQDQQAEITRYVNKFKLIKEEEAKDEAAKIISRILPRVAQEGISEHLVTMVDLPSEDMKGKIIWREWRNINTFEKVTWVEVLIDDTPLTLKISSYDPEKRFIAAETMSKLVKDGRINPVYIEKFYNQSVQEANELFLKKGKETLALLNIPMMNPEIVEYVGRFHIRYSYGQNLLLHSIEVARIAEMMANELWLNAELAKKAGLLHDIGKIDSTNGEAHTKIGAEILRKYKMHEIIINTAEGHHFDVELLSPEAWVATAADIISASRPGARHDTKDIFFERMSNLENLINSIEGVQKAYIMQAWREIMAFFNPEDVDDKQAQELTTIIGTKIEEQLDYPWSIRIVGIRENKMVHYLR